jgi:hypothetical protein
VPCRRRVVADVRGRDERYRSERERRVRRGRSGAESAWPLEKMRAGGVEGVCVSVHGRTREMRAGWTGRVRWWLWLWLWGEGWRRERAASLLVVPGSPDPRCLALFGRALQGPPLQPKVRARPAAMTRPLSLIGRQTRSTTTAFLAAGALLLLLDRWARAPESAHSSLTRILIIKLQHRNSGSANHCSTSTGGVCGILLAHPRPLSSARVSLDAQPSDLGHPSKRPIKL